ncbi:MAG: ComF family protein [Porcipelethomonas sp.]
MNKTAAFLLDLIFPNRCPVCDGIIAYDEFVCGSCLNNLEQCRIDENAVCKRCGKKECICGEDMMFSRTAVCFYYEDAARAGILSLKDGSKNFGYYIGILLAEKIKADCVLKCADYIVPVPMSRKRLKERRYNQAKVIAREISDRTGIALLDNVLFKNDSQVQHTLSAEQRKLNVSAFYSGENDLSGKKIILCDDVLTTGSTLKRCAQLLIDMNAAEIYAAVGTTTKLKKE